MMTLQEEMQRWALLRDQAAQILREEAQGLEERAKHHENKSQELKEVLIGHPA